MGLPSCVSTPPIACPLAFVVVTINGLEKSSKARIKALLRVFFSLLKVLSGDRVHTNTLSFLRIAVIEEAIRA